MRIDAYTHFIPKIFMDKATEIAGEQKDIGKRMRGIPVIYDLDQRRKLLDQFPDYAQIISYAMPPPETFIPRDKLDDLLRIMNAAFADICRKHKDQFPGFVAQVSLAAPDAGVARPNARSKNSARWACRSTPTSPASRSTDRNMSRSSPP